jgi:hypothetical protein
VSRRADRRRPARRPRSTGESNSPARGESFDARDRLGECRTYFSVEHGSVPLMMDEAGFFLFF